MPGGKMDVVGWCGNTKSAAAGLPLNKNFGDREKIAPVTRESSPRDFRGEC